MISNWKIFSVEISLNNMSGSLWFFIKYVEVKYALWLNVYHIRCTFVGTDYYWYVIQASLSTSEKRTQLLVISSFSSAFALYYGLLVNNSTFILINAVGIVFWGLYIIIYVGVSTSKVSSFVHVSLQHIFRHINMPPLLVWATSLNLIIDWLSCVQRKN